MKEKNVWYGILHIPTNKLLGFTTSSNPEGVICVSVCFCLDEYSDNVWMVKRRETADKVRIRNTLWYNAGYESPENTFNSKDLKVVELIIKVK